MDVIRADQPIHGTHVAAQVELLRELLVVELLMRRESIEDRGIDILVELLLQFSIRADRAEIAPGQAAVQIHRYSVVVDVIVAV